MELQLAFTWLETDQRVLGRRGAWGQEMTKVAEATEVEAKEDEEGKEAWYGVGDMFGLPKRETKPTKFQNEAEKRRADVWNPVLGQQWTEEKGGRR